MSSGVLATIRPADDEHFLATYAGPADTREAPGLFASLTASARLEQDQWKDAIRGREYQGYKKLAKTLTTMGVNPASFRRKLPWYELDPAWFGSEALDNDKVWQAAKAAGIKGLPDTQAEYDRQLANRDGGAAADQSTLARGRGLGASVGQFAGGAIAGMAESNLGPFQFSAGVGGETLAQVVLRNGLFNAADVALNVPEKIQSNKELGRPYSAGDAAMDVGSAFVGGAVLSGLGHSGGDVLRKVDAAGYKALAPVRERVDRFFVDQDLANAFAKQVPVELRTPQQEAALHVLIREASIDESSPYVRTLGGDQHYREQLGHAGQQLAEGKVPAPANFDMAGYLARSRIAESSGNDAAAATSSNAVGRYQFIPATWLRAYRRTFGDTGENADAILAKRTDGAVQDQVMQTLTRENLAQLRAAGLPQTEGNAYLMHVLGQRDAERVLQANPDAPIGQLVAAAAIKANPGIFDHVHTAGELARWAENRMGRDGPGAQPDVRPAPLQGDPADDVLAMPGTEDTEPVVAPVRIAQELPDLLRPLVEDRSFSLNDHAALANELGVEPDQVTKALDTLAERGEITKTSNGIYRRPTTEGPEDMLRFLASKGGLSPDGLGEKARLAGYKGDHLEGGLLNYFVPRRGPLLRKGGMGIDEAGEKLWDAGYFGPPDVTPRPTEAEVIAALEHSVQTGERRFSFFDSTDAARSAPRADLQDRMRLNGEPPTHKQILQSFREKLQVAGHDPAQIDQAYLSDAAYRLEWGDAHSPEEALAQAAQQEYEDKLAAIVDESMDKDYGKAHDIFHPETIEEWKRRFDQLRNSPDGARFAGPERVAGDAGGREAGGQVAQAAAHDAAAQTRRLTPAERDALEDNPNLPPPDPKSPAFTQFDDPAGDGVKQAAESSWHDIRQAQQTKSQTQLDRARETAAGMGIRDIHIDKTGPLGPEIEGLHDRWPEAVRLLKAMQTGDARGVLSHPAAPKIDVVWGNQKGGLAHILAKHPGEIGDDFQAELYRMKVVSRSPDKIRLANDKTYAVLARDLQGKPKTWLLTAYGRSDAGPFAAASLTDRAAQSPGQSASRDIGAVRTEGKDGQSDFAAPSQDQKRTALERQTEGRAKGKVPQKAPGSDGGLFDNRDTSGDLFDLEDGQGPRTITEIADDIAGDRAAIDAMRKCLK